MMYFLISPSTICTLHVLYNTVLLHLHSDYNFFGIQEYLQVLKVPVKTLYLYILNYCQDTNFSTTLKLHSRHTKHMGIDSQVCFHRWLFSSSNHEGAPQARGASEWH